MHISTAHLDDILSQLDSEEDLTLYNLAQALQSTVSDIAGAILVLNSRIDDLEAGSGHSKR